MRFFRNFIILLLLVVQLAPVAAEASRGRAAPRVGVNDPRYAALVMDPKTGEILHSRNADTRRYPASLTKMMTLYLLFEALEDRKVSMGTELKVSNYAATMPQTNLSLRAGTTIPVETAIKALVVRSANDVAVVVGENLGGSVGNFAQRMTNRARELGMRSTVFKNPNGLPNAGQVTTARDMAKLGIALKRDFPQYYHYFATRQFSYQGVTYYTHNRVMLRYAGTDGIKTGFINASGFNVVTSTTRGGRPLIGVVLGGTSGGWRDTRMIELLNQGYRVIASRGQQQGRTYYANLPTPRGGAAVQVAAKPALSAAQQPVHVSMNAVTQPAATTTVPTPTPLKVTPATGAKLLTIEKAPQPTGSLITVRRIPSVEEVRKAEAQAAAAALPTTAAPPALPDKLPFARATDSNATVTSGLANPAMDMGWGIQVGAFSSQALAEQALRLAYSQAAAALQGSRMSVVGAGGVGTTVHRARLENLSEKQAKKACETLISYNSPCFIFKAGL